MFQNKECGIKIDIQYYEIYSVHLGMVPNLPEGTADFSFLQCVERLWGAAGVLSTGVKGQVRGADNSLPASTEVKNSEPHLHSPIFLPMVPIFVKVMHKHYAAFLAEF
jgi:hypothetical protein